MSKVVLVLGSTGQCGRAFVKRMLQEEVRVIAASRNPAGKPPVPGVQQVAVDILDKESLRPHIRKADFVVSLFGSQSKKNVTIYSKAYPVIFKCMEEEGKNRIVLMTASHHHADSGWMMTKFLDFMLGQVFEDMERCENWLKAYKGPVQYTVVRPFRLMSLSKKGYKVAPSWQKESTGFSFQSDITDLADFMARELQQNKYVNAFVDVGSPK